MVSRSWVFVALFATLIPSSGCVSRRVVVPLELPPASLMGGVDVRNLTTHATAVRGIAGIMTRELRLPIPAGVTVFVYTGRAAFEDGLIADGRITPARAAELSDFAAGVGKRGQLLLHDDGLARPGGREWLRLIAHELTHVSQIELAHGEGLAEQWLAEGMSEWVAFTVLERLGLDTVTKRRAAAARGVRGHRALAAARLDLATLGTPRGFTARHRREGSLATYQLAFLMTDYLVSRNGFESVVAYLRSFAAGAGREDAFAAAFDQTIADFEQEVLSHLQALTR